MGEIEFVPWHKLHVYDVVNEPMIHIHNVCTDILVTRDHTLLVRPDDADRAVIIKSQDIPTDAFWVGTLSEGDTPFDIDLDGECRVDPELDVSVVENYSGTVFCFSVPSHGFFVTRRNGKIAVQGNTSYAALDFAERQVFEPERQDFDYWVNRYVLPPLGIKHWRLKSNGPMLRDPEALSKMIHDLGDVLTPNTALELAQDVFGRRFGRIDAEWGDKPLKLTVAEIATRNNRAGGPAGDGEDTVAEDADPDNQAPNNEATQTNAKSDNKGEKGKTADQPRQGGKFGTKAPKKAPKAPSKPKRPTVKKTAEDAAEALVSIADTLEDIRVEEVLDRIARKRKP